MNEFVYCGYLFRKCPNLEHNLSFNSGNPKLPTGRPGGEWYLVSYMKGEETQEVYCRHFTTEEDIKDSVADFLKAAGKNIEDQPEMTVEEYYERAKFFQDSAKAKLKKNGFNQSRGEENEN